jgi:hypothetical protein
MASSEHSNITATEREIEGDADQIGKVVVPAEVSASPLALKIFLDALAELIAEAILEEATQGTLQDAQNTSSPGVTPEAPSC